LEAVVLLKEVLVAVRFFEAEGGYDDRYELVIGLETELRVNEQSIEDHLEFLMNIIFDDSDFEIVRQLLKELVFCKERVGAILEVFESVYLPLVQYAAVDVGVEGQESANFYDQAFYYFYHEVGVLAGLDLVIDHEKLDLLDRHRVKQHAYELKHKDHSRL